MVNNYLCALTNAAVAGSSSSLIMFVVANHIWWLICSLLQELQNSHSEHSTQFVFVQMSGSFWFISKSLMDKFAFCHRNVEQVTTVSDPCGPYGPWTQAIRMSITTVFNIWCCSNWLSDQFLALSSLRMAQQTFWNYWFTITTTVLRRKNTLIPHHSTSSVDVLLFILHNNVIMTHFETNDKNFQYLIFQFIIISQPYLHRYVLLHDWLFTKAFPCYCRSQTLQMLNPICSCSKC